MARTTIKDIARECGVSLSTVSLVLNNNPRISVATREKVLASVARHQYQPNAFARSLASKSSRAISVVVPHLNHVFADIYFGEIVSGIYERASELDYKVLLDVANLNFLQTAEHLRLLKSRRVDGALFVGSSVYDDYLLPLAESPYPCLLVNHHFPQADLNCVEADYIETARMACRHLLELGHRRIGLIVGTNTHTGRDFHRAFTEAAGEGGAQAVPWADGWYTEQGGAEGAQWLFERHPDLTAIMAGNDKMALGALGYLIRSGRRVPQDVSVMGIDDIPGARLAIPALTTIRHNLYQLGSHSVDNLLGLFRKEIQRCREIMPVEMVLRESTAPAPR